MASKVVDHREVVLAFAGALILLTGWIMLTHSDVIGSWMFGCTTVHPDNPAANGFFCYSATPIDLAKTQIIGMALGVCGVIAIFFGINNLSR
jgi:hypothetical protein